jgi:hypothetical protein
MRSYLPDKSDADVAPAAELMETTVAPDAIEIPGDLGS